MQRHTYTNTLKQHNINKFNTISTTNYTLCDVNTEDTTMHNFALMTSTSRFYSPYPLGTIIYMSHKKTERRLQHPKGGRKV